MIGQSELRKIVKGAAIATLPISTVKDVLVEPMVDSTGEDALRVIIVLEPDAVGRISGDAAVDTLVAMQARLRDAGDDRFAYIEYATEADLQKSDEEIDDH